MEKLELLRSGFTFNGKATQIRKLSNYYIVTYLSNEGLIREVFRDITRAYYEYRALERLFGEDLELVGVGNL